MTEPPPAMEEEFNAWYDDELVRTDTGWRFRKRVEELSFFDVL